jgi:hypothetical protein
MSALHLLYIIPASVSIGFLIATFIFSATNRDHPVKELHNYRDGRVI